MRVVDDSSWSHLDLRNPGEVRIYVNFETKTDKRGEGIWLMLPGATANADLDPYILFRKYGEIIRKRDVALVVATARPWTRMDSDGDGTFTVYRGSPRDISWISEVPTKVASWLNLSTPQAYTGHCMRRTCAQWLADSGQSEPEIMHFFGWKSTNMVKVYTEHSTALKQRAASSLDLECRSPWNQDVMREQRAKTVNRSAPKAPISSMSRQALKCSQNNHDHEMPSNFRAEGKTAPTAVAAAPASFVFHGFNVMILNIAGFAPTELPSFRDFGPLPLAQKPQADPVKSDLPEPEIKTAE
jgi:hypothetical protein